ncbi:helix-turn-helix domain-containing protein [Paracandidimonas lactea]|uniref:helix-turn-helix domain-containing protein n=1 Tax=Paracandidimonas lactea TaxID=2895524 RepID=UPI001EF116D0|nr:XRE family transcriptional regulator [Paracandidimonas lactea]
MHTNAFIDFWLGQRLRELRKAQNLSLSQLAAACGMSVGLLSQIERGLSAVSLKNLRSLARELNVSVNSLLENFERSEDELGGWIARKKNHTRLQMSDRKIIKEIISPPQASAIELYRARIKPGGSSGEELFVTARGTMVGTVLEGVLELWIEKSTVLLAAGDSFCYSSEMPRRWRNPSNEDTVVLWAISK